MLLYDIAILIYAFLIKLASLKVKKAQLWCDGRKDIFERMRTAISPSDRVLWVHVASLGEFEQGRPLIEDIKAKHPEFKILLTFFSPSGYKIRKGYKGADYIFYLPIDTTRNAQQFLDIAHPEIAIFVKYEYWLNLLFELKRRNIESYIVSAIFRKRSVFFRWWGFMWRNALRSFNIIFVQDENSKKMLNNIGFESVVVAGDTRFDRVATLTESVKAIPEVVRFCGDSKVVIAGSSWHPDEQILATLASKYPQLKFIIAPHEIDEEHLVAIDRLFGDRAIRFTNITPDTEDATLQSKQVLILNTMGMLSSLYQYGDIGYIGGGFGVGIHNTLEAATFGMPIAFGPNYLRFKEAVDLVELGVCQPINNAKDLEAWITPLLNDDELLKSKSDASQSYVTKMCGATKIITHEIFED